MSWISLDDETTGNPIGMGSNLTFSGSGELDNGWNVALSVAMDNQRRLLKYKRSCYSTNFGRY